MSTGCANFGGQYIGLRCSAAVVNDDVRPRARESLSRGAANASGCSRNQRRFVAKTPHVLTP